MDRLTPISPGVVHSSPYRTRLKTAKWQNVSDGDISLVKDALERVPGVTEVRSIPRGFVIEHEARPDVVENIGVALAEVSPVLLEHLTESTTPRPLHTRGFMERFKFDLPSVPDIDLSSVSISDVGPVAKKSVPYVLAGAGTLLLLEGQSLLAGVGPLALFYWAFDFNWKMKQEKVLTEAVAEQHE